MSLEQRLYIDHSRGIDIFSIESLSLRIEIVSTYRISSRLVSYPNEIAPNQLAADPGMVPLAHFPKNLLCFLNMLKLTGDFYDGCWIIFYRLSTLTGRRRIYREMLKWRVLGHAGFVWFDFAYHMQVTIPGTGNLPL